MTINTQGMSYGDGESTKSLEEQRAALPDHKPNQVNLISDALKEELKAIINEVLDEREYERKLNGPYDMIEELDNIDITPADIDDAYAHHFNFVGIDTSGTVTLDDLEL